MPKPLKFYIAGVVTLGALALGVATLVFPAGPGIAMGYDPSALVPPTPSEIVLGLTFWTVVTLIASALPVRLPLGTQQAVAMAPVLAAITLGR